RQQAAVAVRYTRTEAAAAVCCLDTCCIHPRAAKLPGHILDEETGIEVVRPVQDDVCLFRQGFEKRAVTMAYVDLEFEVRPDLEEPLLGPRRFRRLFSGRSEER